MLRHTTFLAISLPALSALAQNPPYLGCVVPSPNDSNKPLAVNMANFQKILATPERCASFCTAANTPTSSGINYDYPLFALNNFACYCGFHLSQSAVLASDDKCSNPCSGNETVTCGGYGAFSLYGDSKFVPRPEYLPGLISEGCKVFDAAKFTDSAHYKDDSNMTVNACTDFCVQGHGKYAMSLDNNDNCYCTNTDVNVGIDVQDDDFYCNHPCSGDERQTCGGRQNNETYVSHWAFNPIVAHDISLSMSATAQSVPTISVWNNGPVSTSHPVPTPAGDVYDACQV